MKEEFLDLYEIIVDVDTTRERARIEKYRVKKTAVNFIPQGVPSYLEGQAYSHRLSSRVPVEDLMKVKSWSLMGGTSAVHRSIYCLAHQRKDALKKVVDSIDEEVKRMVDNVAKIAKIWDARGLVIHERVPGQPGPKEVTEDMI